MRLEPRLEHPISDEEITITIQSDYEGIKIEGENKWVTVIQNATKRTNEPERGREIVTSE